MCRAISCNIIIEADGDEERKVFPTGAKCIQRMQRGFDIIDFVRLLLTWDYLADKDANGELKLQVFTTQKMFFFVFKTLF